MHRYWTSCEKTQNISNAINILKIKSGFFFSSRVAIEKLPTGNEIKKKVLRNQGIHLSKNYTKGSL